MRIVSPFRDCYDGCQMHGVDENLTYVRKTKEQTIGNEDAPEMASFVCYEPGLFEPNRWWDPKLPVGLKGKDDLACLHMSVNATVIMVGSNAQVRFDLRQWNMDTGVYKLGWAVLENLEEKIAEFGKKNRQAAEIWMRETFRGAMKPRRDALRDYVDRVTSDDAVKAVRRVSRAPVLTISVLSRSYGEMELTENPRLASEAGAPSLWPAYQAWQDIVTYLANEKNPDPKVVEIADEYKIRERGFDEWSFRRHKSQSKKPRKRAGARRQP